MIEYQGQDAEIVSIRNRVQSGTGNEGWTIHVDSSLQYRGRVVVGIFIFFCFLLLLASVATHKTLQLRRISEGGPLEMLAPGTIEGF